jgi:hypothetical protein
MDHLSRSTAEHVADFAARVPVRAAADGAGPHPPVAHVLFRLRPEITQFHRSLVLHWRRLLGAFGPYLVFLSLSSPPRWMQDWGCQPL